MCEPTACGLDLGEKEKKKLGSVTPAESIELS